MQPTFRCVRNGPNAIDANACKMRLQICDDRQSKGMSGIAADRNLAPPFNLIGVGSEAGAERLTVNTAKHPRWDVCQFAMVHFMGDFCLRKRNGFRRTLGR